MNLGIWYLFKYVYEENTKLSHIHFYKGKKKKLKNMPHQEISGEKKTSTTVTCWY